MPNIKVEIAYNNNLESMMYGYRPEVDTLRPITTCEIDVPRDFTDVDILERVWRIMNVVNGDELPTILHVRSMCVGDVAFIDHVGYACANAGWKRIESEDDYGISSPYQTGIADDA